MLHTVTPDPHNTVKSDQVFANSILYNMPLIHHPSSLPKTN